MAGFRNWSLWMETKQKRVMEIKPIVVHESKTHMEIINGNALYIMYLNISCSWWWEEKRPASRGSHYPYLA